jgi:DNA-binding transcriptional LysR family regulator
MDNHDLNGVRTFAEVVRAGGFAAAARRLGIPRSTVSLRVQKLEASLGVRLLKRSTRAIALTAEGHKLFEGTERALGEISETMRATLSVKGELKGPIRFSAPADFPTDILAAVIGSFQARHPQIEFDIVLSNAVLDLIADNIDIALRVGLNGRQDTVTRHTLAVRFGWLASPDYLARRGEPGSLDEIETLAVPTRPLRDYLERHVIGRAVTRHAIQANNFMMIRDLILTGHGVGLLPMRLADKELASGRLRQILPRSIIGSMNMRLSFPSRADISERVRAFADHLSRHFAQ